MPEKPVLVLMLYLCVRNRGLAHRTPVDNTGTFIDISLFIQLNEHLLNRLRAAFIHGKTLSVPVCRGTQSVKLVDNPSAILFFPVPALLQKAVSAQFFFRNPLLFQAFNHLYLCGDCRMVCSRLPQSLISLHPLITGQNILHGIVQSVSHVKLPCNVWRRHNNRKRLFVRIFPGSEILIIQPFLVKFILNL